MSTAISTRIAERESELDRLHRQTELNAADRETRSAALTQQIAKWDAMGTTLRELAYDPAIAAALAHHTQ